VFGDDDRVRVADTTSFPWNTVAFVQVLLRDGTIARCSGVLVSPYALLTAAHCLFDVLTGGFIQAARIYPGLTQAAAGADAIAPYGYRDGVRAEILLGYVATATPSRYDLGVIFFLEPISEIVTQMPLEYDAVPSSVTNAGYPREAQREATVAQWYSQSSFARVDTYHLYHDADTGAGSNGSVLWALNVLGLRRMVANHTFGSTSINGGTRLTSLNRATVETWLAWMPPPPPPANDNFAGAAGIDGLAGSATGTNAGATRETNEPVHGSRAGGGSVWWRWTAPASGTVSFTTEGSTFDTRLAIYTGAGLTSLAVVAANDDFGGPTSRVEFAAAFGTTYHVAVDGNAGASGNIRLTWSCAACAIPPPATGLWWSVSQPGIGYGIEARAGRVLMATYAYRADGSPVWYLGSGDTAGASTRLDFVEYLGGQSLTGSYRNPSPRGTAGSATLTLTSSTAGTLAWAGGPSVPLSRFPLTASSGASSARSPIAAEVAGGPLLGPYASLLDLNPVLRARGESAVSTFDKLRAAALQGRPARALIQLRGTGASNGLSRQAELARTLSLCGAEIVYRSPVAPVLVAHLSVSALELLRRSPESVSVSEDTVDGTSLAVSTVRIGADRIWSSGSRGADRSIAIVDTGVDTDHPFVRGRIVDEACFSTDYAFVDDTNGRTYRIRPTCPNGATSQLGAGAGRACAELSLGCHHGTHVAGIAAGSGTLFSGVAPEAGIVSIQVFSRLDPEFCGAFVRCIGALQSDTVRALDYAYLNAGRWNLAAVNISLGGGLSVGYCDSDPRKPAIDNLRAAGVATIVAAGNDGSRSRVSAPACISTAVRVGAVDSTGPNDRFAEFSNEWSLPMLLAPGASIESANPGATFVRRSGTSMATPHVAGAWTLLRSIDPAAGFDALYNALTDAGLAVRSVYTNRAYPRIDVAAAADALDLIPETGWWWNPLEPGRGFFLEVRGRTAFVSAYMYDEAGNAEWYISQNTLLRGGTFQGTWQKFADGQSLGGAWRSPRLVGNVGAVTLRFSSPRNAVLTLPTGVQIPIGRFYF
jgi:V8-like Glu-specific endopeptidase